MEAIRKRAKELFPSIYLTLVSIIQSLALGYLLSSLKDSQQFWTLNSESLIAWLQIAAMCQIIFLIWHEYVVGVISFQWVLGISDSIIPFGFGISQFALISFINPSTLYLWLYSMGVLNGIALFAYKNMYRKAKRDTDNEEVLKVVDSCQRFTEIIVAVAGVVFIVAGLWVHFIDPSNCIKAALVVLVNIIFVAFIIVRGHFTWQRIIRP